MATSTPSAGTPLSPNQTDPAFAGVRGYRALGAYSSARDNYGATPSSGTSGGAPATGSTIPTLAAQQIAQAQGVWDATTQSFRTGNPNPMIDAAQSAAINDATRFEDRFGISHDNPINDTLNADQSIHNAANKIGGGTVICTEVVRRGDATSYDLAIEYRFVEKFPSFVVRGYRIWAIPYVALMQKSELVYKLTRPLAKAFMQESAALLGLRKHSFLGAAIILVGTPICAVIGAISLPLLTPCEV